MGGRLRGVAGVPLDQHGAQLSQLGNDLGHTFKSLHTIILQIQQFQPLNGFHPGRDYTLIGYPVIRQVQSFQIDKWPHVQVLEPRPTYCQIR